MEEKVGVEENTGCDEKEKVGGWVVDKVGGAEDTGTLF